MAMMLKSERERAVRDDIAGSIGEWVPSVVPSGKSRIVVYLTIDGCVRSYEITVRERLA